MAQVSQVSVRGEVIIYAWTQTVCKVIAPKPLERARGPDLAYCWGPGIMVGLV